MSTENNNKLQIITPIIIGLVAAIAYYLGATSSANRATPIGLTKEAQKFKEIITAIDNNYVDTVDINKLTETAITKMLEELDPHTAYIPKKESAISNAELKGGFEGVGIEFNIMRDTLLVVAPISGGPSEQAGIQSGDKIIKVDSVIIAGIGINNMDVFDLLRGTKGTTVLLSIKRSGEKNLLDFIITRDKIPQYSVDISYMVDDITGYIKINRFSNKTHTEFREAIKKLKALGMKQLIIDLQNNPGGYLERATQIADELLPGNPMIVYTKGRFPEYDTESYGGRTGIFEQGAIIVLIDEGSASASEILAGALQDNDRALIVGRRSFGKGLVQYPLNLSDSSELRITISRYYTPSGRSIQKPYDLGDPMHYNMDMVERYNNGEYFHADSIQFNDSLRYTTSKGRYVYGGGGIMPDYFVGIDTTMSSSYLNNLFYKNVIREYSLNYYNERQDFFKNMSKEDYIKNFEISSKELQEFIKLGITRGVPFEKGGFNKSKNRIKLYLKAYLARAIWRNEGFYPIYNLTDEIFMQALNLFEDAKTITE